MLRVVLALLLSVCCTTARAVPMLWDYTVTAFASAGGVTGMETVRYRFNPDDLTVVNCMPSIGNPCVVPDWWTYPISNTWIPGTPYTLVYGPVLSVRYSGIVNGASGPTVLNSFDDDGLGCTKIIGGTRFREECTGWLSLTDPVAQISQQILPVFWPGGGEDGFAWTPPFNCQSCSIAELTVTRSLTPVGLTEPGTVALLAVWIAGLSLTRRNPALRRDLRGLACREQG